MEKKKKDSIREMVLILKQLDETSILLLKNGAELLAARNALDKHRKSNDKQTA